MKNIDAPQFGVNGRTEYPTAEEYRQGGVALDNFVVALKKTPPDQFSNVIDREWRNRFYDLCARGIVNEWQILDRITLGADGRASCLGVVDEFRNTNFPAPRTLDEARVELAYTESAYRPGDEPDELIKRLLPKNGVTMIGGQSGAGKTFALIAMALALATGTPFLGHPVRERVGVIIAAAEGAGTIAARLEAAKRHLGITEDLPIGIIKRVPDLKDGQQCVPFVQDVRLLAEDMERRHGVRVGVLSIDTITSAFSIENENDNSEAAGVCKILAWMGGELQMAIVPVHHFGKSADQGLRGASAWRANVDHGLSILADRDGATGQVTARSINVMKSRIGEEGPVCGIKLVPITLGVNRYGEDIVTCATEATDVTPAKPSKKLPSAKADRQFSKAFDDVVIGQGKIKRVRGDGKPVRMVPIDKVRDEFMKRYISGGGNRGAAARVAWKRALDRALDGGCYAARVDDQTGLEMVWDMIAELPLEMPDGARETYA